VRAALLLLLLAQARAGDAPATIAPEPAAPTTVAPVPAPAPPPPSAASLLVGAAALEATQRLPLAPGAEVVVDPAATFEVELSARAPDARLVLVDARDDLVPASGTRELAAGTRLTLAPAVPLVPGSRYALRLDGASTRELHDEGGRAFAPLSLPILAAGTPPPPEPKRSERRKRRR
jgi:hypothetical protein